MAENSITQGAADSPEDHSKMAAVNAVFSTYELLESTILKLEPKDIPAMSLVNKACHDITSCNKIYQQLMSSPYFHFKLKTPTTIRKPPAHRLL